MAKTQLSPKTQYLFLILASTFLQGSSFVSTKIVMNDIPPLWTASARFLVAALSMAPLAFVQMRRTNLHWFHLPWIKLLFIGSLQTAGVMAFLNLGLMYTTPPTAAIIMASNPLLVIVLAWIFLRERSSPIAILGMVFAFFGVVICIGLNGGNGSGLGKGEILVSMASVCWACSTVLNKKFNLQLSPWVFTFWQMLLGSLILAAIAALSNSSPALPSTQYTWFMFFWLAIPASTGAMGLWFAALRHGGSVQTSGFLFLCPLFAALISFGLYGQIPGMNEVGGGLMIAIGLVVLSRWR